MVHYWTESTLGPCKINESVLDPRVNFCIFQLIQDLVPNPLQLVAFSSKEKLVLFATNPLPAKAFLKMKGCSWTTKDDNILGLWRRIQSGARDKVWSLRPFV